MGAEARVRADRPAGQTVEERAIWLYRRFNTVYLETGQDWDQRDEATKRYWRECARAEMEREGA